MGARASEGQFLGSLLGLALGDAMGARYEGRPSGAVRWSPGGGPLVWTDDTQMALGLAESLVRCGGLDPDDLARAWAEGREPDRGYGPGAWRLLDLIEAGKDWRRANRVVFPEGSFGNGAAMRAAPLGLYFRRRPDKLIPAAERAAEITHAHPLGIEGGVLIARTVALALGRSREPRSILQVLGEGARSQEFRRRLACAAEWVGETPTVAQVERKLGNTVLAHESAVTAVFIALQSDGDFVEMMRFVLSLGGDTDTIGAMAGGIFGARYGKERLPQDLLSRLEQRPRIERAARALWKSSPPGHFSTKSPSPSGN